jgi:hypothetical protein
MFKKVTRVMPKNWPISVVGVGVVSLAVSYGMDVTWPGLAISVMSAMVGAAVALYRLGRYEAGLAERVMGNAPFVWDVWLNGIRIGTISDSQYAGMQRDAMRDARLIFAQLVNLGHVALNVAGCVCATVPRLAIWLAAAAVFVMPDALVDVALAWRTAEPDTLIAGLRNLFELVAVASVLWVAFRVINGYRFGFCNQYDKAVGRMIRQQCNTPTVGELRLTRWSRAAAERMSAAARC